MRASSRGETSARTTSARGSSSTGLDTWISPPSSWSFASSASARRHEPPRANGQPTAWPIVSSASPKPPLGRRSSGSIEWAAWPANQPRVRSSAKRLSARGRAAASDERTASTSPRVPRRARTSSSADGDSGSGPSSTRSICGHAATSLPTSPRYGSASPPQRAQGRPERLAALEHRLEQVAVLVDALQRLAHPEVARPHLFAELLPAQRRRDRRTGLWPHRVRGRDRLAVSVLAVVDQNSPSLLLQPLRRHETRVLRFEPARHQLGELVRLRVRVAPRDRDEHVDPVRAARLHIRAQLEPVELLADEMRDLDRLGEAVARLGRVEVEDDVVGPLRLVDARV